MASEYASKIIKLLDDLEEWETAIDTSADVPLFNTEESRVAWDKYFKDAYHLCQELALQTTPTRLLFLLSELPSLTALRCVVLLREAREHIKYDLTKIHFEFIAPLRMPYYNANFDIDVHLSFPSITNDVNEAGTCYALGRYTATVFHLIRAIEIGLRATARAAGVRKTSGKIPLEYQEWQIIIEKIETEANKIKQWPRGPAKDNALSFYSTIIADFHFFKDGIRNILVHNRRGLYKEPEAASALLRARECFEMLETRTSENQTKKLIKRDFTDAPPQRNAFRDLMTSSRFGFGTRPTPRAEPSSPAAAAGASEPPLAQETP